MSKATARLNWNLYIDCPSCDDTIDLVDQDDDGVYAHAIFNDSWEELTDEIAFCKACDHEFKIASVSY